MDDYVDEDEVAGQIVVAIVHVLVIALWYGAYVYCSRRCRKPQDGQAEGQDAVNGGGRSSTSTVDASVLQPRKQVSSCYVLWLGAGLVGAHHFYLERLFHGCIAAWTMNFCGVGLLLDAFLLPMYVRSYNNDRAVKEAPKDDSRRSLCLWLPLLLVFGVGSIVLVVVYMPEALHRMGYVDLDRAVAQTQQNPYTTLGLERGATLAEAKTAYRKESLRWHPDRNVGCGKSCENKMSEITKAFNLIKKRQAPPPVEEGWGPWAEALSNDWVAILEPLVKDSASRQKTDL
eukprot:gnl/TRDRNA2_/TRDRNA2_37683_c0_seq1.p1 gnl/TRDRNA2_/TRDRNA2_37683_c0~~gnl/TRDRNA2_/TRDRNA2_37683_c0_seq1.p1  ORF type:complete len:323 (-),score=38.33 gnl/TRDRNA2_/TRDRNA2_37683_c0_seq1:83-943(-)